jgi:MFS family permease
LSLVSDPRASIPFVGRIGANEKNGTTEGTTTGGTTDGTTTGGTADGDTVGRAVGVTGRVQAVPLRRVLVLVSAIVLLDVLFYSAIAPLLPWYAEQLDLTKSQAGLLSGSYALGTLLASLPAGWIAAHRGTRPTLLLGLGLLAASSIAFGVGTSFPLLVAARLVQGVAGAAAWAAALAWLVEVAPRERRGQLIGTTLGVGIAGAMGGPLLGAVAEALGPALVFPAVAVVAVGLGVAVVLTATRGDPPRAGDLRTALRDRRVWGGSWLTTLPALFFGTYGVLVPLRLAALGLGAAGVAAVFLAAAAVEAVMSPVVGRLSDRRGRLLPLRAGLAGVAASSLLLPRPQAAWLLAAVVLLAAGTGGMLFAPASALLSDGAEDAALPQGIVFGLFNLAWAGGQVAGAAGGAWLADATADTVPYLVVAVLALASLAALTGRRPRRHAAPGPVSGEPEPRLRGAAGASRRNAS